MGKRIVGGFEIFFYGGVGSFRQGGFFEKEEVGDLVSHFFSEVTIKEAVQAGGFKVFSC